MTTLGKRSTAEEALRGQNLNGKIAIITGASSGIGIETARVLAQAGADVTLAVRSVEAGEQAKAQMTGKVEVKKLDLTDFASIRAFAAAWGERPIDLLILNAGVMATPKGQTAQGFETQMGTNHLGHFLLTELLKPRLTPTARVVTVSSGLHTRGTRDGVLATLDSDKAYSQRTYSPFGAYGDSKLANILFVKGLAKRGVHAYALHPGVIATNLSRSMGFSGIIFRAVGGLFMKSVAQGAATSVYAATAPELEGQSGAYLSDCAVAEPSAPAKDDALIEQVWQLSEKAISASR
jgi:NAD(P)-dependent dehydrogenase (short-subunit alcohol dehydrogenase family)